MGILANLVQKLTQQNEQMFQSLARPDLSTVAKLQQQVANFETTLKQLTPVERIQFKKHLITAYSNLNNSLSQKAKNSQDWTNLEANINNLFGIKPVDAKDFDQEINKLIENLTKKELDLGAQRAQLDLNIKKSPKSQSKTSKLKDLLKTNITQALNIHLVGVIKDAGLGEIINQESLDQLIKQTDEISEKIIQVRPKDSQVAKTIIVKEVNNFFENSPQIKNLPDNLKIQSATALKRFEDELQKEKHIVFTPREIKKTTIKNASTLTTANLIASTLTNDPSEQTQIANLLVEQAQQTSQDVIVQANVIKEVLKEKVPSQNQDEIITEIVEIIKKTKTTGEIEATLSKISPQKDVKKTAKTIALNQVNNEIVEKAAVVLALAETSEEIGQLVSQNNLEQIVKVISTEVSSTEAEPVKKLAKLVKELEEVKITPSDNTEVIKTTTTSEIDLALGGKISPEKIEELVEVVIKPDSQGIIPSVDKVVDQLPQLSELERTKVRESLNSLQTTHLTQQVENFYKEIGFKQNIDGTYDPLVSVEGDTQPSVSIEKVVTGLKTGELKVEEVLHANKVPSSNIPEFIKSINPPDPETKPVENMLTFSQQKQVLDTAHDFLTQTTYSSDLNLETPNTFIENALTYEFINTKTEDLVKVQNSVNQYLKNPVFDIRRIEPITSADLENPDLFAHKVAKLVNELPAYTDPLGVTVSSQKVITALTLIGDHKKAALLVEKNLEEFGLNLNEIEGLNNDGLVNYFEAKQIEFLDRTNLSLSFEPKNVDSIKYVKDIIGFAENNGLSIEQAFIFSQSQNFTDFNNLISSYSPNTVSPFTSEAHFNQLQSEFLSNFETPFINTPATGIRRVFEFISNAPSSIGTALGNAGVPFFGGSSGSSGGSYSTYRGGRNYGELAQGFGKGDVTIPSIQSGNGNTGGLRGLDRVVKGSLDDMPRLFSNLSKILPWLGSLASAAFGFIVANLWWIVPAVLLVGVVVVVVTSGASLTPLDPPPLKEKYFRVNKRVMPYVPNQRLEKTKPFDTYREFKQAAGANLDDPNADIWYLYEVKVKINLEKSQSVDLSGAAFNVNPYVDIRTIHTRGMSPITLLDTNPSGNFTFPGLPFKPAADGQPQSCYLFGQPEISGYRDRSNVQEFDDDVLFKLDSENPVAVFCYLMTYKKNSPFGTPDYDLENTAISNTITLTPQVTGIDGQNISDTSASVTSQILIGDAPLVSLTGEGCWPTTGLIIQGPGGGTSHSAVDAIDISASQDTPIIAPFAGEVSFYDRNRLYSTPIYGNAAVLKMTDGKQFVFAHMSSFSPGFEAGQTYPVQAGTQIGYMGNSGSGLPGSKACTPYVDCLEFDSHLHYELIGISPENSQIQNYLPETLQTSSDKNGVPGTQYVSHLSCNFPDEPEPVEDLEEVAKVSCLSFKNGTKEWSVNELSQYTAQMQSLLNQSNMDRIICGDGAEIPVIREDYNDPLDLKANNGCNYDGTGEAGAEWTENRSQLHVCDLLFADDEKFGVSSMWHEMGHAVQKKYSSWNSGFTDFGPSGYLPTYPLNKTHTEDFAESFGLCLYNRNLNPNFMTQRSNVSFRHWDQVTYSQYNRNCTSLFNYLSGL